MAWEAPSTAQVLAQFTAQENNTIAAQQGAANLAGILALVVKEIRGAIRSGGYELDADTAKIPGELVNAAVDLSRWRILVAMPALKALQTEERKAANDRAEAKLEKIRNSQSAVEPPAGSAGGASRAGNWGSENKLIPRTHPTPRPAKQFPASADGYANPEQPEDQSAP